MKRIKNIRQNKIFESCIILIKCRWHAMPHRYRMQKKREGIGERTFIRQDICSRYWFCYTMCVSVAVTMVILWYYNDNFEDNWIVEKKRKKETMIKRQVLL